MELTPKHAILTVKNTDKEDESPYKVTMENDHGKDKADMKTEVKEKEGRQSLIYILSLHVTYTKQEINSLLC